MSDCPILVCGHAANAINTDTGRPSCAICNCSSVAEVQPDKLFDTVDGISAKCTLSC